MSLREKLPGRFILRRLPNGPFSPIVAHDEEGLEAQIEAALCRPFDGFDWTTGQVDCGGKKVLLVEFAGVLGPLQAPVIRTARTGPRIEKAPLPRPDHLKPLRAQNKRQNQAVRRGRK